MTQDSRILKKNFDAIDVLSKIKEEKTLKVKLGVAYNPYLKKYYKDTAERERLHRKISFHNLKLFVIFFFTFK